MNIAIIGTRGIPNNYGGFEQFAEYLSQGLIAQKHSVTIYNSHKHPYKEKTWNGVDIVHCYDPENKIGTAGQFIYDFNCIVDTRKKNFDIILQLGYTSSTIWWWLLPKKKSIITTNMDGLEWMRSKYKKVVRKFLRYAEKLGVKHSDYLIADSVGIQAYLKEKYHADAVYIPYGAHVFATPDENVLQKYNLQKYQYNMLIARLEPENNIETILNAAAMHSPAKAFIVIGNTDTKYGTFIRQTYKNNPNIRFLNAIYNANELNNLRYYSNLYFHGHSVGGTNPSLLEAMASNALVCAHDNIFNKSVLENDAFYFSDSSQVLELLKNISKENEQKKLLHNMQKIKSRYSWQSIIDAYLKHFEDIIKRKTA